MIIREAEGQYQFDNPDLEYRTKRQKKLQELEEKYKDKPKIAFHQLSDEGNLKYMQAKRDYVWTILGWSFIGNISGVVTVQYIENFSTRWKTAKHFKKREMYKIGSFVACVAMWTYYGFGKAR